MGVPHADVAISIQMGKLRMSEPRLLNESGCYLVRKLKYCKDLKNINANYKKYSAEDKLSVRNSELYFDGQLISLPKAVK